MRPAYRTHHGRAYHADCRDLLPRLPTGSVSLAFTSPPFALRRPKAYGNVTAAEYLDWFLPLAEELHRVLADDGSLVMEMGGAWNAGRATRSLMPYELLLELGKRFHLAQEFYWFNPARLPTPVQWVCRRRTRVKEAVTMIWWLSKTAEPYADNWQVLAPYAKDMGYVARRLRPSGHLVESRTFRDNGGAIPPNIFVVANTTSNDGYVHRCRAHGAAIHPARMPRELPDFFVRFLTRPSQLVLDPFAGSNTTGHVAEALGRQWLSIEIEPQYVEASRLRFVGGR